MHSKNVAIIAAAGAGKTTRVVASAFGTSGERSALLTFTRKNTAELNDKLYHQARSIPPYVEVHSWFTFLLREMARPYQRALFRPRIEGLMWVNGRSTDRTKRSHISKYYFTSANTIYSDKIADFSVRVNETSQGAVIRRLEERFDHLYIDEVQDMAGYDLDIIELLLRSKIRVTLVGDHRQATYATNHSARNSSFGRMNILKKFEAWESDGLLGLIYECETRRCNQLIADAADMLFPHLPRTQSLNQERTGHDGVFTVASTNLAEYVARYRPQPLRYDRKTKCYGLDDDAMNFGQSKGKTFDRVLIFPNGVITSWLKSGEARHIEKSISKLYVAITRAKHSVAFVLDGTAALPHLVPLTASEPIGTP